MLLMFAFALALRPTSAVGQDPAPTSSTRVEECDATQYRSGKVQDWSGTTFDGLCVEVLSAETTRPRPVNEVIKVRFRLIDMDTGDTITGIDVQKTCPRAARDCLGIDVVAIEDGKICEVDGVQTDARSRRGIDYDILIDASGSVKVALHGGLGGGGMLGAMVSGWDPIVDVMHAMRKQMDRKRDSFAITLFDIYPRHMCKHGSACTTRKINYIDENADDMGSGTALWKFMIFRVAKLMRWGKDLENKNPDNPPYLFVFSDGGENSSKPIMLPDVAEEIRAGGVDVRFVIVGDVDTTMMDMLMTEVGGVSYVPDWSRVDSLARDLITLTRVFYESTIYMGKCSQAQGLESGVRAESGGGIVFSHTLPSIDGLARCAESDGLNGLHVAYYDFDDSDLTNGELSEQDAWEKIKLIKRVMKEHDGATLTLTGYTDRPGSDEYNEGLSAKRARDIAQHFFKGVNQVAPSRVMFIPGGALGEPGSGKNREFRRVEATVTVPGLPISSLPHCK
jgi:hypothetical protein